MISEPELTDPAICPSCRARLSGSRCPQCGVDLGGAAGVRLWAVSTEAAALLAERRRIIGELQARARSAALVSASPPAVPPFPPPPVPGPAQVPGYAPAYPDATHSLPAPRRAETAPRSVQDILLGLGALLLSVAALVFVAVSWGSMGIGGRSAIMGGVTALAVAGAAVAHRRGLGATAEAVGALAVLLGLIDAYGLHATGMVGSGLGGAAYWAFGTAVLAVTCGVGARLLPLASLRIAAAGLGQAAGWLLAAEVASVEPDGHSSAAAVLIVLVAVLLVARTLLVGVARDARVVVLIGQPLAAVAALALAGAAVWEDPDAVSVRGLVVAVVAGVLAVGARRARDVAEVAAWSIGSASAVAVLVAVALPDAVSGDVVAAQLAASAAVALCVLVAVVRALPLAGRRAMRSAALTGPVVVATAVAFGSLLTVAVSVLASVVGPLTWLASPWSMTAAEARTAAADVLTPSWVALEPVPSQAAAVVLAVTAVGAVAGAALFRRGARAAGLALVSLVLAAHVEIVALSASLPMVLAADLVLAAALCVCAVFAPAIVARSTLREGERALRVASAVAAASLLLVVTAWSLVTPAVTLVVLPVVVLILAAVAGAMAGADGARRPHAAAVGASTAGVATLLLGVEVLAAVDWLDGEPTTGGVLLAAGSLVGLMVAHVLPAAGHRRQIVAAVPSVAGALALVAVLLAAPLDATMTVALALAATGFTAAAMAVRGFARQVWTGLAVGALVALSAAAASWAGADVGLQGLVAVCTSGALLAGAQLLRRTEVLPVPGMVAAAEAVAAVGMALALVAAAFDFHLLWIALMVAGVASAAVAVQPGRRGVGWLAAALVIASSWVRLALSGVDLPEAYTVPGAVALLVLGWLRRRRDPSTGSWPAYATALVLLLTPSFIASIGDTSAARPLLLAVVALGVVLAGGWFRLQAPLVIGGGLLALHALVQLAPDLAALYDTVPKWVSLGAIGLVLLVLGATYERRLSEVRRAVDGISQLR